MVVVTVTENCLILRWLCLSIRDVFICFVIIIINIIIEFFFKEIKTPLPSRFTWTVLPSMGLDGDEKKNCFAIKGMWWDFFPPNLPLRSNFLHRILSIFIAQPCWLFFLMTSTELSFVCFSLTDLINCRLMDSFVLNVVVCFGLEFIVAVRDHTGKSRKRIKSRLYYILMAWMLEESMSYNRQLKYIKNWVQLAISTYFTVLWSTLKQNP